MKFKQKNCFFNGDQNVFGDPRLAQQSSLFYENKVSRERVSQLQKKLFLQSYQRFVKIFVGDRW